MLMEGLPVLPVGKKLVKKDYFAAEVMRLKTALRNSSFFHFT